MSGRRWWLIGLLVVAVPTVIWALLQAPETVRPGGGAPKAPSTLGARPSPTPTPTPARIPPVRVEGTTISTVDASGRQQWDLRAEAVAVDGVAGRVSLTSVAGTFFEAGEPSVTFSAPRGTFFIASRTVAVEGGVRARAVNGRTLEAQRAKWTPGLRQIEAIGSVVLRQEGMVIRADRLVSDTSLQHVRLHGNIRVTVVE
jgi:LPS export ABC transporter protein LptC